MPKAIVLSVAAAGVTGVLYLIPILFVLPDIQMLLDVANGQPIGLLFKTVTGSAAGGFGLLFLLLGKFLFAKQDNTRTDRFPQVSSSSLEPAL